MKPPYTSALAWSVLVAVLALYLAVTIEHLGVLPPIFVDEPWIAGPAVKLISEGVFGSDLYTGYYNSEHHYVWYPPVSQLLEAISFQILGVGLAPMRLPAAIAGAVLIVGVFLVGWRFGGPATAAVAATLLVLLRLGTGGEQTGILLLDFARYARPDVMAAAFGMLAFWLFLLAERRSNGALHFATGLVIGLSTMSHLYGVFWLVVLQIALLWRHGWIALARVPMYAVTAGCVLVCAPWLYVIRAYWPDYVGQTLVAVDRFRLLDPQFYVQNLVHEIDRFRFLDWRADSGVPYLLRPGAWLVVAALPTAGVLLARASTRRTANDTAILLIALVGQVLLFALLIKAKFRFYTIATWPLAVVAISWLGVRLWRPQRHSSWIRPLLVVAVALVVAEGSLQIQRRRATAAHITPYAEFEQRLEPLLMPGGIVLGAMQNWLGIPFVPYRSWFLPHFLSDERFHHQPIPFRTALERISPDIVFLDNYTGVHMVGADGGAFAHRHPEFEAFMRDRDARLVGVVEDSTYGRIEVYWLEGRHRAAADSARGLTRP